MDARKTLVTLAMLGTFANLQDEAQREKLLPEQPAIIENRRKRRRDRSRK
jgi:hypothetical protein